MSLTLITATLNSGSSLFKALNSVENQSVCPSEHLFVDGYSQDTTIKIIDAYATRVSGSVTVGLIEAAPNGVYSALNKGLEAASGEIVGFLHSDDYLASDLCIEKILATFEQYPDLDIVYGDVVQQRRRLKWNFVSGDVQNYRKCDFWMPAHPACFVRRSVFKSVGLFDTGYKVSADFKWFKNVFESGIRSTQFFYLKEPLIVMSLGGVSSNGLLSRWIAFSEDYRILRHDLGYGWIRTLLAVSLKRIYRVRRLF